MNEVNCLTIGCNQKHGHAGPHGDGQTVQRSLGMFNTSPVGRQSEEWSAREVRAAPLPVSHAIAHGGTLTQSVTLEGLAAVIGSLSEALSTVAHENKDTAPTLAALNRAARAVTALLTTEVKVQTIQPEGDLDRAIALERATAGSTSIRVYRGMCRKPGTVKLVDARQGHWAEDVIVSVEDAEAAYRSGRLPSLFDESKAKRHAAHVAADIAMREASGQAEANRKARAEAANFAAAVKQEKENILRTAEDAAYNRAITDAHNAMADVFSTNSDDEVNGVRAQAAIRNLYRKVS